MKVAVLSRDMVTSHPGGDITAITGFSNGLAEYGITRVHNPTDALSNYDLIHCYHINFDWSTSNIKKALEAKRPIVLDTIFFEDDRFGCNFIEMRSLLESITARGGEINSWSPVEAIRVKEFTGYLGDINVIPLGVDKRFIFTVDPMERTGILSVNARQRNDKFAWKVEEIADKLSIPYYAPVGFTNVEMPSW